MASRIKGKEIKTMKLSFKFIVIITNDTNNIFIKSEMIINKPCPNMSAILSISETALVIRTPTDDLLKYSTLKF